MSYFAVQKDDWLQASILKPTIHVFLKDKL